MSRNDEFNELLALSTTDKERFLKLVRKEKDNIPMSVRLFLSDKIRNILAGMEDREKAKKIAKVLSEVGI